MKLASHNSMTFLPVRQWWLRPFAFMSRCQSLDLFAQAAYTDFFEIRVRFDSNDRPVFAHGLAEYEYSEEWAQLLNFLWYTNLVRFDYRANVMVHLEYTRKKGLARQVELFRDFCADLEQRYSHAINFSGGCVKRDWSQVYKFSSPVKAPTYTNVTASTRGGKLNDLWPWLWTRRHRHDPLPDLPVDYARVDFIQMYDNDQTEDQ